MVKNWISIKDKKPRKGQRVWYYFHFFKRIYAGKYMLDDVSDICNKPKGTCFSNVFYGKSGWLSDDVNYWMPRGLFSKKPSAPSDLTEDYKVWGELMITKKQLFQYSCSCCGHYWNSEESLENPVCPKCGDGHLYKWIRESMWAFPTYNVDSIIPNCCRNCSNHPANGGDGLCNCALPDIEMWRL
jgi:hypothetical protein